MHGARCAQRLDRDLGEGEEQQATAVRGHMALMAELLALQRARLGAALRQHALEVQVPRPSSDMIMVTSLAGLLALCPCMPYKTGE